jgi:RNA polymerase sigma-70 factor (ECF subfamily)
MSDSERVTLPTEEALVAGLKRGDPSACEAIVRAHAPLLLAITRRILRHEEDARDAVQDAFLSAFRAADGFAGTARLSTWLHRIAVNAALMKMRSRRRRPEDMIAWDLPTSLVEWEVTRAPPP